MLPPRHPSPRRSSIVNSKWIQSSFVQNVLSEAFLYATSYRQTYTNRQITGHVVLSASCLYIIVSTMNMLYNDRDADIRSAHKSSIHLKLMSFNVRNSLLDVDKPDARTHWEMRRSEVQKTLQQTDCDIIGTQEGVLFQIEDIHNDLDGEYSHYGNGRLPEQWFGSSTNRMNEYCSIFWKRNKFRVRDQGTFWLSQTPSRSGSKSWNAPLPRIASWSLFSIIDTEKYEILFISTHLGLGEEVRGKQIRLITNFVRQMIRKQASSDSAELVVFVVGDFNEGIKGSLWNQMFQGKESKNGKSRFYDAPNDGIDVSDVLTDCISEFENITGTPLHPSFTFHDFEGLKHAENDKNHAPIDWILCSKNVIDNEDIQILDVRIITESKMGSSVLPSDHFPIMIEIEIQNDL